MYYSSRIGLFSTDRWCIVLQLSQYRSSTTLRYLQMSNFIFGTLCAQQNTRERERGVSRILAHNVFDLLTSSTILRLQQQQLTSHPKVRFLGITSDRIVDSRVFAGNPRDKCRRRQMQKSQKTHSRSSLAHYYSRLSN